MTWERSFLRSLECNQHLRMRPTKGKTLRTLYANTYNATSVPKDAPNHALIPTLMSGYMQTLKLKRSTRITQNNKRYNQDSYSSTGLLNFKSGFNYGPMIPTNSSRGDKLPPSEYKLSHVLTLNRLEQDQQTNRGLAFKYISTRCWKFYDRVVTCMRLMVM